MKFAYAVHFNNPHVKHPFYYMCNEPVKLDAPSETAALKIIADKLNSMKGRPVALDNSRLIPLKEDFSFYVDENTDDPCVAMLVRGHKHIIATVEEIPVKEQVDFEKEAMFTVNYAWHNEYYHNESDSEFLDPGYIIHAKIRASEAD